MKNIHYYLLLVSLVLMSFSSSRPAYKFYTKAGKEAKFNRVISDLGSADVILFGELHNNPISHWLQYEISKVLAERANGQIILGAEMIEADNQQALDKYLQAETKHEQFAENARLWPNYITDYKPLVDLAKENKLAFIATNIPRKYASIVARGGLEALDTIPANEKKWMAPLPLEVDLNLPGYKTMLEMDMGHHFANKENFAKAQAIKDATMAHYILKNLEEGKTFIHFNGAYHSNNYEGIYWYLNHYSPGLKIITLTTVESNIPSLPITPEQKQLADYIIVIPASMTKTH